MSYIILRGHWCHIVLNVHAPTEDKIDDMKDSFYKELELERQIHRWVDNIRMDLGDTFID
jgi:hypothetical protein